MNDSFTEEARGGAHNIDQLDELVQSVRSELDEWAAEADVDVTLEEVYINGSYGANTAHSESDIDLTIGVTGPELSECNRATEWLQDSLGLHDGWWKVDPCVLPVGRYLYGHLEERSEHGDYENVYDVLAGEYVDVWGLR